MRHRMPRRLHNFQCIRESVKLCPWSPHDRSHRTSFGKLLTTMQRQLMNEANVALMQQFVKAHASLADIICLKTIVDKISWFSTCVTWMQATISSNCPIKTPQTLSNLQIILHNSVSLAIASAQERTDRRRIRRPQRKPRRILECNDLESWPWANHPHAPKGLLHKTNHAGLSCSR